LWLLDGEVLHTDSLGSEQLVRPGELNVMTADRGIAHAEQSPPRIVGRLHGVQLWVAQPDATRHGLPGFEHHPRLPIVELDHGAATVLAGSLGGHRSPATVATELLGADLALRGGRSSLPLRPDFEHAVVPPGPGRHRGRRAPRRGRAALTGTGRDELALEASAPARVLVVGGTLFAEPVLMWWNFVARTRSEVDDARSGWEAGADSFGTVGSTLERIGAPPTPWR
jgi:redox-sensitive bicupin YhaK (pirin superfamily)